MGRLPGLPKDGCVDAGAGGIFMARFVHILFDDVTYSLYACVVCVYR